MFDRYAAGPALWYLTVEMFLFVCIVIAIDFLQQSVRFRQYVDQIKKKGASLERERDDPINTPELRDAPVVAMEDMV